jgi:group II intron reverse transcriptase/maturase
MEPWEGNMAETPSSGDVFTQRLRIGILAEKHPEMSFTSLNHLLQLETLEDAFHKTRKDGATGVDGQTAQDYEANLQANLQSLLDRAKSGTYQAPPVRRVRIPKDGAPGETRPLGIPTFEDKVLQRAVAWILSGIYDWDFRPCSYGFRKHHSAHDAVKDLHAGLQKMNCGWVLEVDIRKFFDTLDHGVLRDLLRRRVRDGVLLRLIGKWLNAGVLEEGALTYPEAGSPQGGVISPLLANVYLHYVLDDWFINEVQPRLRGKAFLIRYADDFVIGFTHEEDARRVMDVLPQRFAKYGLTIHPDKTRLVPFERPRSSATPPPGSPTTSPGAFDFLGFTHYWARTRKGWWVVRAKTAKTRLRRAIAKITEWCRRHLHDPPPIQWATLRQKILGHYAYYGVSGNYHALDRLYAAVCRIWRRSLSRRSQKSLLTFAAFFQLLERLPLPKPRIVHKWF